ncbi:flagellar protein FliT [Mesobacillus jeotgali]|uniref:Flagellar protein FliT n=1 Tax=Mesobacillus jeotgali TaxID=129985 RepID=A0ABY9VFY5_9BACI|nr:flagellar protein FliT [Mesobacillus jeotgali]WNF22605.1 flagellar protein FliT [Mesobacillus jeotgali]
MSAVKEFLQLTDQLIQLLESSEGDRDNKIAQAEQLLEKRELLMEEILPPYTPEETELGKRLVQMNRRVSQLLLAEKISIQKDIKGLQIKKESNSKYVNTYQSLASDGMFYDKRK